MTLQESKCEACRIDAPLVTESEKAEFMSELSGWKINNIEGIDQLAKVFNFNNYLQALDFAKSVAMLAEEEDHHPKIVLEWGRVEVHWWSIKLKGYIKMILLCCKNEPILLINCPLFLNFVLRKSKKL